jgi:hypothetical protein
MAYYRLYLMDGFSGHVTGLVERDAASDREALKGAVEHRATGPMEIWCLNRKVRRWVAYSITLTPPEEHSECPGDFRAQARKRGES